MRYAARVDSTQAEIVAGLRKAGISVWVLGLPVDLMAGYMGEITLIECKRLEGKRKPRPAGHTKLQLDFMATWKGKPVVTVTDAEQAIAAVRETT